MQKILIIEDEPDLASLLNDYLQASGFVVNVCSNGLDASAMFNSLQPELVILDLMLPGKDGISICKELRACSNTPIIMTTAKVDEIDRLLGLEIGADDYICKPYSPREVVARAKAVLRRFQPSQDSTPSIQLDTEKMHVTINNTHVSLTTVEIRLFGLLFNEPGKIFSRQFIMDNIYSDYRVVSDRTVDSHVKKLRKKLHDAAPNIDVIHSIYGAGYKFDSQYV